MRVATLKSYLSRSIAAGIALVVAFSLTAGAPAQAYAAGLEAASVQPAALTTAAVKAPTAKNYSTLVKKLTKRFSKGGKSAALSNATTDAAFALNLLGAQSKIDVTSVKKALATAQEDPYFSAGTMAKFVVIFRLAGEKATAKTYLAKMESLMTKYESAWSAPWILMAYHLTGKKPSASAAMTEKQLAKAITDSQTKKGWFGGEYGSVSTTAQGVIALEGVSSASKAQAKAVKAILAAQNKDGGFYDGTAYSGGTASNVDTTGECVLALYRYGKANKSYSSVTTLASAANFLVKKADSNLSGYQKNTLADESMSSAAAFAGLVAAKSASSLTFGMSKATVSKISAKKFKGKAIKPALTVKYNGVKLKKGTDYTLSYKSNKKVGTAKVIIKGKGNFKGTKTVKFKIVK